MLPALVADYGSDSSVSESEDTSLQDFKKKKEISVNRDQGNSSLVRADVVLEVPLHGKSASIFSNPFLEAKTSQLEFLEKHVKMTNYKEPSVQNDRKICWKFMKGRCAHGDHCKFDHPPSVPSSATEEVKKGIVDSEPEGVFDEDLNNELPKKRKKKSGLKAGLEPPKKFMKIYNKHKEYF